jgi:hypothetical protein
MWVVNSRFSKKSLRRRKYTIEFAIICKKLPISCLLSFISDYCSLIHQCFLCSLDSSMRCVVESQREAVVDFCKLKMFFFLRNGTTHFLHSTIIDWCCVNCRFVFSSPTKKTHHSHRMRHNETNCYDFYFFCFLSLYSFFCFYSKQNEFH